MKRIAIVLLLLVSGMRLYAVSAYPYPVEVQQPNGEVINIRMHGDEFFHYITVEDGSVVMQDDRGYYVYANISEIGNLVPSAVSVTNQSLKSGFLNVVRTDSEEFKEKVLLPASKRVMAKRLEAQRQKSSALRSARVGAADENRYLVILVNFSDKSFTKSAGDFSAMLNQTGYEANGATGSVKDYYVDNSTGKFEPQYDVYGPVTLLNNMAYYGANDASGNDVRPEQMIIDACRALDSQIDFSLYARTYNGQQLVDNVYVFYAGYSEASGGEANTIWPHKYSVYSSNVVLDGVRLADYACSSELRGRMGANMVGIGTFTHEFGHVLGLPDFYDANYANDGQGLDLGTWSVMASGNYLNNENTPPYLNALERLWLRIYNGGDNFKWGDFYSLPAPSNSIRSIAPITNAGAEGYLTSTYDVDDFYIFEARQKNGWDQYLPGEGMLVFHIDWTEDNTISSVDYPTLTTPWSLWLSGIPNIIGDHQCMDLLRASGVSNSAANSFPGSQNITSVGGERLQLWNGEFAGVELRNITRNESDGSVSFIVSQYTPSSLPENALAESPGFYVQDKRIFINGIVDQAQIDVYDIGGRLCVSSLVGAGGSVVVSQPGIYIVKMKEADRTVQSKVTVY